jgi:flagella basal body P-ring formation protein FlgA
MMLRLMIVACVALAAIPMLAHAEGVRIVMPVHDIARGDVIADSDLTYGTAEQGAMFGNVVTSMNQLDGMQTRRVLRAGEAVRADDVRKPVLVTKGSTVTMTFSAPGVQLSATGKAMSEGGLGETVVVLNPVSYRQVSATVIGAGQVRAGDVSREAERLAAEQP